GDYALALETRSRLVVAAHARQRTEVAERDTEPDRLAMLAKVLDGLDIELLRPVEVALADRDCAGPGQARAGLRLVTEPAIEPERGREVLLRPLEVPLSIGEQSRVDMRKGPQRGIGVRATLDRALEGTSRLRELAAHDPVLAARGRQAHLDLDLADGRRPADGAAGTVVHRAQ